MCDCQDKEINRLEDLCQDCQEEYIRWYQSTQFPRVVPVCEDVLDDDE